MNTRNKGLASTIAACGFALGAWGIATPAWAWGPPAAQGEVVLEDYIIQKGDTCVKIARRRFGNGKRYDLIHEHNPNMGPTPHRLVPGEVLKLPVTSEYVKPDAELTHTHREVRARAGREETWGQAELGLDLYKGWRVNTLERAAAEVTFRDTSIVQLRADTLIIIYGATRAKSKRSAAQATLESGALRARLGELAGEAPSTLELETPGAKTSLEGGEALVKVDEAQTSRVANHGEGKAKVSAGGKSVDVGPKMGSKVVKGKKPTPPAPLPPTPAWSANQAGTFVGASGLSGTLRGSWAPVAEAKSYFVEVSRRPDGGDVVAAVVVPGTVNDFELRGFPPGEYYVRIASVDADEFESPPTAARPMKLVEASISQPGGREAELGEAGEGQSPVPRVLPGTIVNAPEGMRCNDGAGELSAAFALVRSGSQRLQCVDAQGAPAPGFEVEVIEIAVAGSDEASRVTGAVGEEVQARLALQSAIELPERLRVRAPEGIEVSEAVRAADGSYQYTVRATEGAPLEGELEFLLGEEGREAVIARAPFAFEAHEAAAPPVETPELREREMFELGVFGGLWIAPRDHALVGREVEFAAQLRPANPQFGLRMSVLPIDYLALEWELAAMPARTEADGRALVFAARGLLSGQLATKVTPVFSVGGGLLGVRSDAAVLGRDVDGAFVFGAGVKFYPRRTLALRLDVRDTLTSGPGTRPLHTPEVTFALSWNFGPDLPRTRAARDRQ